MRELTLNEIGLFDRTGYIPELKQAVTTVKKRSAANISTRRSVSLEMGSFVGRRPLPAS